MNEDKREFAYWMALAHLPKMRNYRKNELIAIMVEEKINIMDFFHLEKSHYKSIFSLSADEILLIEESKKELPNLSFIVEDLLEQGYEIIPITSKEYSPVMKKNMKMRYSPPLIYTKGNKQIMKEKSIAIVGSRKAAKISLEFTDNIAKAASKNFEVVVSGFAKGVDKQALDSAIKYKGQSIIVLPQGITTFRSGFKKYYKQIIEGDVLVLSTFHPNAPWSVQLAMARNPVIYGLARDIYVAESSDKGGTWSGVNDGLKKGRTIYVRIPGEKEKNANKKLIQKGAVPVDINGKPAEDYSDQQLKIDVVSEQEIPFNELEPKIVKLLSTGNFSSKDIIKKLNLNLDKRKLTDFLKHNRKFKVINKTPLQFTLNEKSKSQQNLFE